MNRDRTLTAALVLAAALLVCLVLALWSLADLKDQVRQACAGTPAALDLSSWAPVCRQVTR